MQEVRESRGFPCSRNGIPCFRDGKMALLFFPGSRRIVVAVRLRLKEMRIKSFLHYGNCFRISGTSPNTMAAEMIPEKRFLRILK